MKLVLFDIDGTILNTNGAGRRAISRALEERLGLGSITDGYRFDGKTDRQIVRDLLGMAEHPGAQDDHEIDRVCTQYVGLLAEELAVAPNRCRLYPGVAALLEGLHARDDITVGLLTGNVAEGARLKLVSVGLDPAVFPVGAFGSDSSNRLDLPAVAKSRGEEYLRMPLRWKDLIVIGDTPADVACALHAGGRAVAVSTGSFDVHALRDAGAHHVFDTLEDISAVLAAILE